jgi:hypothetical protein
MLLLTLLRCCQRVGFAKCGNEAGLVSLDRLSFKMVWWLMGGWRLMMVMVDGDGDGDGGREG